MIRHRVRVDFDIDVDDEEEARLMAAGVLHRMVADDAARGIAVEGDADQVLEDMRAAVSLVVMEILSRGVGTLQWATIDRLKVQNSPLGG